MTRPGMLARIALSAALAAAGAGGGEARADPEASEVTGEADDDPDAPREETPASAPEPGAAAQAPSPGPAPGAAEAPPLSPVAPPPPNARERLDQAVRAYQLGKRQQARDILVALVNDPAIEDTQIRQQARIYLGELLYVSGDEEGARRFFELVLDDDPTYIIDPFRHPPDVCGYFNYVRSYKVPVTGGGTLLPDPLERPAVPGLAWAPFGVYHLSEGAPLRGTLYALGGTAAGTASLLLFYRLSGDRSWPEGDEIERARLRRLKLAQYGTTAGFYGLWGVSIVDAHTHWRRRHPLEAATLPAPALNLSGRF